jgi:hypothetical protein
VSMPSSSCWTSAAFATASYTSITAFRRRSTASHRRNHPGLALSHNLNFSAFSTFRPDWPDWRRPGLSPKVHTHRRACNLRGAVGGAATIASTEAACPTARHTEPRLEPHPLGRRTTRQNDGRHRPSRSADRHLGSTPPTRLGLVEPRLIEPRHQGRECEAIRTWCLRPT